MEKRCACYAFGAGNRRDAEIHRGREERRLLAASSGLASPRDSAERLVPSSSRRPVASSRSSRCVQVPPLGARGRAAEERPDLEINDLRPTTANDAWDQPLWGAFVCTTPGLEVPVLSSLSRRNNSSLAQCGCKKHCMDLHGDHTTCTAHSGSTKVTWMVQTLGPLFRAAGHTVRTQHGVTHAGQRGGGVKIRNYMRDQAGSRSLSITHAVWLK